MARGSKRKRGDTWELRVYVGIDPATGRQKVQSKTFRGSAKLADGELRRMIEKVEAGHRPHDGRRTFAEAAERWLTINRGRLSPGSVMTTEDNLRRYLLPTLGHRPVERIQTDELDELYGRLLTKGSVYPRRPGDKTRDARGSREGDKHSRALTGPTVTRAAGDVHTILEACRRWRWIARNPADDIMPIPNPKREPTTPEEGLVRQLRDLAIESDPEFGLFVRVAAIMGGRRAEECGLRWPAVDLDNAVITVQRRLIAGRDEHGHEVIYERPGTKNKDARRPVAIDPLTVDLLRQHRKHQAERAALCGVRLRPDHFVFSYEPDCSVGWKPHTVTQRFRRMRDKAGDEFAGIRLYDLRHYVASHLMDRGLPTVVVSQRLGHAPRTTEEIYGHPVVATDRLAAEILAAALDG